MSRPISLSHLLRRISLWVLVCLLAACTSPANVNPTSTVPPLPALPTPLVTLLPNALATALPTPPPTLLPVATATTAVRASTGGRVVTFKTADGFTLGGTLYGGGPRAVILSNIGSGMQADWQELPGLLAERGYMVLTYDWRGFGASGGAQDYVASVQDLAAAIDQVRAQGATRIVLAGGSLGGIASIKNAQIAGLAGLVVMSSPLQRAQTAHRGRRNCRHHGAQAVRRQHPDTTVSYSEMATMYKAALKPKLCKPTPALPTAPTSSRRPSTMP